MQSAKKGLITDKMTKKEIQKLGKLANQSFPKATKNGIWGDPTKSTKKEGQAILAEIINNLSKRCQTCLTGHSS
jgi:creatinine amidohydrolase